MLADIISQWLWIFPVYSFFGWCLEVIFCSVNTGKFVNRGFLNGTACPIYGIGAGFLVFCLEPVQGNLPLLYLGSVIIGSLLELVGGFLLKKIFHMSWWDYSEEPFNIGGYICLKFSLAWGVAGVLLMRAVHPVVAGLNMLIPTMLRNTLLVVFYSGFATDVAVTVAAVLKLNRDLQEITRLTERIQKNSDRMAESLGNKAIFAAEKIKGLEITEKAEELSARFQNATKENRNKLQTKLDSNSRLNSLLNNSGAVRSRLLKAFPRLKNMRDSSALSEMRNRLEERLRKGRERKK